jgi:teichuronic acid exporter
MDLRDKVLYGLRWSASMRFLQQLFTWGVTLIVVRLLSPGDYGLMELAGVFISLLSMISELGMGAAVVQRRGLDEGALRAIFGFALLVNSFFCIFLSVAAPFIADFYNEPKLVPIIWFLSLSFMFSGLVIVPSALLLRAQNHRKIAIIEFLAAMAGALTTLIMALNGMGVWALVGGVLSIRIAAVVGYHLAQPFLRLPQIRFKGMKSIFIYGWTITFSRILWYLYSSASASLIVGKVLGKEILGIYGIGLYLACLPMEKVSGIINQLAFPAFSSIQDNPHLAGAHFIKAVRVLTIVAIPVFWGMSSIAFEIVEVFLGSSWSDAALPLQIIAIGVPLRMVRNLMTPALLGLGHSDIYLRNEFVAMVLMSPSFYFATFWGLAGVSFVWLLIFPLVFSLNLPRTAKALSIRPFDIARGMCRPALAGLTMLTGVELTRRMVMIDLSTLARMVVFIAVGAIVYAAMTFFFNRKGFYEVMSLCR